MGHHMGPLETTLGGRKQRPGDEGAQGGAALKGRTESDARPSRPPTQDSLSTPPAPGLFTSPVSQPPPLQKHLGTPALPLPEPGLEDQPGLASAPGPGGREAGLGRGQGTLPSGGSG